MHSSKPFFRRRNGSDRLYILREGADAKDAAGAVLYIHPFAEEMNRSRRMAALQARAFADTGWRVLQIDLFGCGDSAGKHGDATWSCWLEDTVAAVDWLRSETGHVPVLWGLRAGCLLATQAAALRDSIRGLLLWQPVTSGKQHLQQFLRLKVAASLIGRAHDAPSGTRELRDQLARGEAVEVAGYTVSAALAREMDCAQLQPPSRPARVAWLEVAERGATEVTEQARIYVERWREAGHAVESSVVQGPRFWQTLETSVCPALVEKSVSVLREWRT